MHDNILEKTRCYLSGPMDFVGSRVVEKYFGWRAILTPILKSFQIRVLDPWNKPPIRGHKNYGQEGVLPNKEQYEADFWTNPATRVRFERDFWETVHIDLRMTDLSDFLIAFVPTNVYSVGTVHEVIVARQQIKPVMMISPPIHFGLFPELHDLTPEVKRALKFAGLRENPQGIPSQWYGNIVGGRNMFDGFGWEALELHRPDFYEALLETVLADARPAENTGPEFKRWENVSAWAKTAGPLRNLKGSIASHVKYADDTERALFEKEVSSSNEAGRRYFWHNQPYTPKRSMLYQFLCIASGYIPPKLNILSQFDAEGNVVPVLQESADDDWLLISTEQEE